MCDAFTGSWFKEPTLRFQIGPSIGPSPMPSSEPTSVPSAALTAGERQSPHSTIGPRLLIIVACVVGTLMSICALMLVLPRFVDTTIQTARNVKTEAAPASVHPIGSGDCTRSLNSPGTSSYHHQHPTSSSILPCRTFVYHNRFRPSSQKSSLLTVVCVL